MTPDQDRPAADDGGGAERDRVVRDHYGTSRRGPLGLACLLLLAILLLINVLAWSGVVLLIRTLS